MEWRSFKPTISTLFYLLGNLRAQWRAIGRKLGVPEHDLEAIKEDFPSCCRRCMIEMLATWCQRANCNWSALITALRNLDEGELADKIAHYTDERQRIRSAMTCELCYEHVPVKKRCYDDWWLQLSYCDLDTLISEGDKIAKFLLGVADRWYDIGICLGVRKNRLDAIEREYRNDEEKLSSMIRTLVKISTCKWGVLASTLQELNLISAAESVVCLAERTIKDSEKLPAKMSCMTEYRRRDFCSQHKITGNSRYHEPCKKICIELQFSPDVSDVLDQVAYLLESRSRATREVMAGDLERRQTLELSSVHSTMLKIGDTCNEHSECLEEHATELLEQLKRVQIMRSHLENEKSQLEMKRKELVDSERQIGAMTTCTVDESDQTLVSEGEELKDTLEECIKKMEEANENYKALSTEITSCCLTLDSCQKKLRNCKKYIHFKLEKQFRTGESNLLIQLDFSLGIRILIICGSVMSVCVGDMPLNMRITLGVCLLLVICLYIAPKFWTWFSRNQERLKGYYRGFARTLHSWYSDPWHKIRDLAKCLRNALTPEQPPEMVLNKKLKEYDKGIKNTDRRIQDIQKSLFTIQNLY